MHLQDRLPAKHSFLILFLKTTSGGWLVENFKPSAHFLENRIGKKRIIETQPLCYGVAVIHASGKIRKSFLRSTLVCPSGMC